MKRQEYLDKLELELRRQNIEKVQEILVDYHEHFEMALAKGKSEEDIVAKLGDPSTIAKAYHAENLIQKMEDAPVQDQFTFFVQAILRLIILTPLNFILLLGPGLIVFIAIVSMWSLVLSLGFGGVAVATKLLTIPAILSFGAWGFGMIFFAGISTLSGAVLGILLMFFITKIILQIFVRYLRWNIEFVKGESK